MEIHFLTYPPRGIAMVLLTVALPLSFLLSCNNDNKDMIEMDFDPQTSYTLKKSNVVLYISDTTGITKNKIITQTWLSYSKASDPYSFFPDGVYIEQYDSAFNVEARIQADTAYNYERRKLWEAIGNVDIVSKEGKRFETSQCFWDEQKNEIYGDSFIRITGKDGFVNTGIGFISNADMSNYTIKHAAMEIFVETQRRTHESDSIPADTILESTVQMQQPVRETAPLPADSINKTK